MESARLGYGASDETGEDVPVVTGTAHADIWGKNEVCKKLFRGRGRQRGSSSREGERERERER